MKDAIKKAVKELLETRDLNTPVRFKYTKGNTGKGFEATMQYSGNNQPEISLLSSSGYNPAYIKGKLKNVFTEVINAPPGVPVRGDLILTAKFVDPSPAPGTKVFLDRYTYYYSVNGSSMNCNGDMIGVDCQAEFIKRLTAKCSPASDTAAYSQLKLL